MRGDAVGLRGWCEGRGMLELEAVLGGGVFCGLEGYEGRGRGCEGRAVLKQAAGGALVGGVC